MTKEDIEHIDLSQEIKQVFAETYAKADSFESTDDLMKSLHDGVVKVFSDAGLESPFAHFKGYEGLDEIRNGKTIDETDSDPDDDTSPAFRLIDYLKVYRKEKGFLRKKIKPNYLAGSFAEYLEEARAIFNNFDFDGDIRLYGLFFKEINNNCMSFFLPLEMGLKEKLKLGCPALITARLIKALCDEYNVDKQEYLKSLEIRSLFGTNDFDEAMRWHLEGFLPDSEVRSAEELLSETINQEIRYSVVLDHFDHYLTGSMKFEDLIHAMNHPTKTDKEWIKQTFGPKRAVIDELTICEALTYCLLLPAIPNLPTITYEIKDGHILLHKKEPVG